MAVFLLCFVHYSKDFCLHFVISLYNILRNVYFRKNLEIPQKFPGK